MRRPQPIPGVKPPPFWRKHWFEALITGVPPLVTAAVAALKLDGEDGSRPLVMALWGSVAWLALVMVMRIWLARGKDAEAEPQRVHDGLRAATLTLHAAVAQICDLSPDESRLALRVTFHRVVPPLSPMREIEQIVPYAGGRGDGAGRRFPVNVGITGLALRNREPYLMSSHAADEAAFRQELVRWCGYTDKQAEERQPGRVSALAVPVHDRGGQHPLGVIYLDSNVAQIFDDDATYQAILAACQGVVDYVSERY